MEKAALVARENVPPLSPDPVPAPIPQAGLLALLGEMMTVLEIAVSHIPAAHNVGPRLVAARAALTALGPAPPREHLL
mgnify:FL=1